MGHFCRRLLYDDHRGVGEPLNETVCRSDGQCEGLTVSSKQHSAFLSMDFYVEDYGTLIMIFADTILFLILLMLLYTMMLVLIFIMLLILCLTFGIGARVVLYQYQSIRRSRSMAAHHGPTIINASTAGFLRARGIL